jgi:hypothetical protein
MWSITEEAVPAAGNPSTPTLPRSLTPASALAAHLGKKEGAWPRGAAGRTG